jgi:hypothetical protein
MKKRYLLAVLFFVALNHLLDWGPFNLLVTVYAQATTVTGQVKDVNVTPYAGARLIATLANADGTTFTAPATVTQASSAICQAAGLGPAPCKQPFPQNIGPVTLDGGGNIPGGGIAVTDVTLISPAGKLWLITVNTPGTPPPLGTGPQTCTATIAISGGSQSVSSNFSGCPALSSGGSGSSEATLTYPLTSQSYPNATSICVAPPNQSGNCLYLLLTKAHTLLRYTYNQTVAAAGCSTPAALGVMDATTGTILFSINIANGASNGFVDSGPLSIPMIAGDKFGVGLVISPVGCGTSPSAFDGVAVYQ